MKTNYDIYPRIILVESHYQQFLREPANKEAFNYIKEEARNENPWAVVRFAEMQLSENDEFSQQKAIELLLPLATSGFAFAQLRLAQIYLKLNDTSRSKKLLRMCVNARIPDAALILADIYKYSKPKKSGKLAKLAARWGVIQCEEQLETPEKASIPKNENDGSTFDLDALLLSFKETKIGKTHKKLKWKNEKNKASKDKNNLYGRG